MGVYGEFCGCGVYGWYDLCVVVVWCDNNGKVVSGVCKVVWLVYYVRYCICFLLVVWNVVCIVLWFEMMICVMVGCCVSVSV